MKKTLAAIMALSVIMTMTSCQNDTPKGSDPTTTSTEDLEKIPFSPDCVPHFPPQLTLPEIELDNKCVELMTSYDVNPGEDGITPPFLALFEGKYAGTVEWVETTEETKFTDLVGLIMSGSSPDLFPADAMDTHPMGAVKGLFQPIDNYIDLSSELWSNASDVCDKFMWQGGHYVGVVDIIPACICIYNTDTIEAYGFDDPYDLYQNGDWDWYTFKNMCVVFSEFDDNNYALDGWAVEKGIMTSSGKPLVDLQDGTLISNVMDPTIENVQNFLYKLGQKGVLYPKSLNNGNIRDGIEGAGIADGTQLFCIADPDILFKPLSQLTRFGDFSNGNIAYVPMPKNPELDYYPIWSKIEGYHIVKGAKNPVGAAAFINCCKISADLEETLAFDLRMLKEEYGCTIEMCGMLYEIRMMAYQNPVFDFSMSVSDELSSQTDMLTRAVMIPGEKTWDEARDEYAQSIDTLVAEANNALQH